MRATWQSRNGTLFHLKTIQLLSCRAFSTMSWRWSRAYLVAPAFRLRHVPISHHVLLLGHEQVANQSLLVVEIVIDKTNDVNI